MTGNAGGAGSAVTFAQQKQGRRPAIVARDVQANEFSEGFDVAFHSEIFFCEFRVGGAAEAGCDGIHHDDVAAVEQRVLIVGNVVGSGRHKAVRLQDNSLRT